MSPSTLRARSATGSSSSTRTRRRSEWWASNTGSTSTRCTSWASRQRPTRPHALRDAGVDFEIELVPEKPARALLAVAESRAARLIVVGTHGEGPLAGALLGSVPQKLVHRSAIPVLVVPAR